MRVLLVEDDRKASRVLAKGLEEEGFVVDVAYSGEDGEELAAVNEYDLVVLDWLLPGKPGLDVCAGLRARGLATPILMLTARDAVADRVAGLNRGADDYLTKPFAFAELLARIQALLRRGRASQPPASRARGAAPSALDPHASQSIGRFCANCHDGTRSLSQAGILGGRADRVVFTSLRTADPPSCQRCHAPADHGRDFTAAHGDIAEHSGGKPCLGCHSQSWSARDQTLHADFLAAEKTLKANPDDPRAALAIGSENFCVNCHRADGKWR